MSDCSDDDNPNDWCVAERKKKGKGGRGRGNGSSNQRESASFGQGQRGSMGRGGRPPRMTFSVTPRGGRGRSAGAPSAQKLVMPTPATYSVPSTGNAWGNPRPQQPAPSEPRVSAPTPAPSATSKPWGQRGGKVEAPLQEEAMAPTPPPSAIHSTGDPRGKPRTQQPVASKPQLAEPIQVPWGQKVKAPSHQQEQAAVAPTRAAPAATNPRGKRRAPLSEIQVPSRPTTENEIELTEVIPSSSTLPPSKIVVPTPKTYIQASSSRSGGTTIQDEAGETNISPVDPLLLIRPRRIPERGPITNFSPIQVKANHYAVGLITKSTNKFPRTFPATIFQYSVSISPIEAEEGEGHQRRRRVQPPESGKGKDGKGRDGPKLPDRILPIVWQRFVQLHAPSNIPMPFDGKSNCYTARILDFNGQTDINVKLRMVDPDDPDKIREFRVIVKFSKEISTKRFWQYLRSGQSEFADLIMDAPQDIVQALDVALHDAPSRVYVHCDKNFFHPQGSQSLDHSLDLWYGHYQSLLLVGSDVKPTLNMDLATKAFYKKMPVSTFLQNNRCMKNLSSWTPDEINKASEFLKGKLIEYGTGSIVNGVYEKLHKFTAVGLVNKSARSYKFKSGETEMSIEDYMRVVKGTKISKPHYPCLHIGSQKMTNYVPLELAFIIPQAYRGKMGSALTKEMIKRAALTPVNRFDKIKTSMTGCKYGNCEVLKEFGIEISPYMTQIDEGKRFHPPVITTALNKQPDNRTAVGKLDGKWGFNGGRATPAQKNVPPQAQRNFLTPASVPMLGILCCVNLHEDDLWYFMTSLSKMGETHGMTGFNSAVNQIWENPQYKSLSYVEEMDFNPHRRNNFSENVACKLEDMKKNGVKLVIVVMSQDGKEYASVKAEAEVRVGILTACIKMGNVTNMKPQTQGNYLLKLNSKLNGMNWSVANLVADFQKEPVIIFGADVSHPTAANTTGPSFAAVTASYNLQGMGYNMRIQPQKGKQEEIDRIGTIVREMLLSFYRHTGQKPKKLIMFRDGVSEGQFDRIKEYEYSEIKKVCDEMGKPGPIKVTFVIVKKRHHTRFQPCDDKKDAVGIFKNIPPGTVVDTQIVHPTEQEFFLNSHVGIQGTSKPTKYHVIHDDNNFTMSQMQKLTYFLCYAFVRCTHPVSYPAATYYAHIAASRAKALVEKDGEIADLNELQHKLTIHPDLLKNYPMFFI